jgi:hypothetical protein
MRNPRAIVWIDDEPKRQRTAKDLGADFINVRDKNLEQTVIDLLKGPQPELIIVDHILDKTKSADRLFQRGSTIAEAIKEQWPACPVVGVTNVDNVEAIDERTKRTYDALFPFQEFRQHINQIFAMRKGFALVARSTIRSARGMVALLKPPKEELDRVEAALPDDLKKSFRDPSRASRLHHWVSHLVERPGFLYDKLWVATFLGLTEIGFEKVSAIFEKAQYKGVFAFAEAPRWWSSRLSELLYEECKPEAGEMSWETGRRLPGVKGQYFSRCYNCDKEFPETVAYIDRKSLERHAMHLKCTVLDPRYNRELYFEDYRMMQGK